MIYHLHGKLVELNPAFAVVECGGVGYQVNVSLNSYSAIQGKSETKLYTHTTHAMDGAQTLFGFATPGERDMFVKLIGVSGVGGNSARLILSGLRPSEVTEALETEDVAVFKAIKGIGAKTAQRIIVDLKGKTLGLPSAEGGAANTGVKAEAMSALEVLGYPPRQTERVVAKALAEHPEATLEEAIKEALKKL